MASGIVALLAAAVLWGTVGPAQLLADTDVAPVALGACRMLLGGLALGVFTVRRAGLRTLWRPGARLWMPVSILVTAAFQACFLEAVDRTGAALATAVTFGTVPVVSGLWARGLDGERGGAAWWCGTVCSVAGVGLLLVPGEAARADAAGVFLGVVAGAGFGTYITATKRLARHGADTATAAPVSVVCAGVLVSPWLFAAPDGITEPRAVALVCWLALGTTALGYLLFTRGVARVSAATAGTLSLAEPLVATVLGFVLLGERLSLPAACGAGLLLTGLVVVSLPARGRSRDDAAPHTGPADAAQHTGPAPNPDPNPDPDPDPNPLSNPAPAPSPSPARRPSPAPAPAPHPARGRAAGPAGPASGGGHATG
ncbi:DMT family transporter [Streptomyces albus]|uniref:DMT family transporter n=1 Tax=Streptomyces albus TaxID=1888 RepID=UPI0033ED70E0